MVSSVGAKRHAPALAVLLLTGSLIVVQLTRFPAEGKIAIIDVVGEGIVAALLLAAVFVVQRLRDAPHVYRPVMGGTTLLYVFAITDFTDEFVDHPNAFSWVFEDITAAAGAMLLVVGLYFWSVERQRQLDMLRERAETLEQQNRHLDRVASVIAHDIRNPLNVASGHIDLVDRESASEHLATVEEAIDRVERIASDVLTFARNSRTVISTQRVDLDAFVREGWENVETGDCELHVDARRPVAADPPRLERLFENLFRNAVEHGEARTVRVEDIPTGFAVDDDGTGIPSEERDDVLEFGYTTASDGTGFGLAIVATIAEAHGWEVDVNGNDHGGTRIEFRNVESPAQSASLEDSISA